MTIPDWLSEAASRLEPHHPSGCSISLGDIRTCDDPGFTEPGHLVVVLDLDDDERGNARIALIEEVRLLATDTGVILDPTDTGLNHPVAVETMLNGTVWRCQLDQSRLWGQLDTDVLERIRGVLDGAAPVELGLNSGPPLQHEKDGRIPHRATQFERLARLTAECRKALLGHPPREVVDPTALLLLDDPEEFAVKLTETFDAIQQRPTRRIGGRAIVSLLDQIETLFEHDHTIRVLLTRSITDGSMAELQQAGHRSPRTPERRVVVPPEAKDHPRLDLLEESIAVATQGCREFARVITTIDAVMDVPTSDLPRAAWTTHVELTSA